MSTQRAFGLDRRFRLAAMTMVALFLVGLLGWGLGGFPSQVLADDPTQGNRFLQRMASVAESVTVSVINNRYVSQTVEIQAGDTVTWTRIAGFHSVTADNGSFEQPLGSSWESFSHRFDIPGEYLYYCSLHGGPNGIGMAGKVVVLGEGSPTPTSTSTSTPPVPTSTATATATATVTFTPTPTSPATEFTYLPWVER